MQLANYFSFIAAVLSSNVLGRTAEAFVMNSLEVYTSTACSGIPAVLRMSVAPTCGTTVCRPSRVGDLTVFSGFSCVLNHYAHTALLFGEVPYVLVDEYSDENCQVYMQSMALRANGDCLPVDSHTSRTIEFNANGSATSTVYLTSNKCDDSGIFTVNLIDNQFFDNFVCENSNFGNFVYYNNAHPAPIIP